LPRAGDKWHLDEVVLKISGVKHWLWRAVDQSGIVLDVLVQRRRDKRAAKRLLRKLLKKQNAATPRHDHRQAGQLWRGQTRGHARH
jgi:putative transposase